MLNNIIRDAVEEDFEDIVILCSDSHIKNAGIEEIAESNRLVSRFEKEFSDLSEFISIYVASNYDRILGVVGLKDRDEESYQLVDFYVDPRDQNCGIGTKLLNQLIEDSVKAGKKYLFAEIPGELSESKKWYEKRGFVESQAEEESSKDRTLMRLGMNDMYVISADDMKGLYFDILNCRVFDGSISVEGAKGDCPGAENWYKLFVRDPDDPDKKTAIADIVFNRKTRNYLVKMKNLEKDPSIKVDLNFSLNPMNIYNKVRDTVHDMQKKLIK